MVHDRTAEGSPRLVGLRLRGIGRGEATTPVPSGEVVAAENRVEIRRDAIGIVEWFVNTAEGLEQGFTLAERPVAHRSSSALVLELSVDDAEAALRGDDVALATASGRRLSYGKLNVFDAGGRALAARFEVPSSDRIRLVVEDSGAAYPIVIDPILTELANARLESDQLSAALGTSVAAAGDVDGDGFGDVIVGAPLYDAGQANEGAAFVFLGSGSGVLDGSPLSAHAQLESNQVGAQLGASVASAGDVNGDGFSDVIVGAPFFDLPEIDEGVALVFLGSASGLADGNATTAHARFEANQASAALGDSVASAGDLNRDGFGDVVVGAPGYSSGQSGEGAAFVFHGSAAGLAQGTPATAAARIESNQVGAGLGGSVAAAGDVNGDGFGDLLVGAESYGAGQFSEGAAFVYLGGVAGVGDGNPVNAHAQLESDQVDAFLGGSVASAGDVNGDGYGDVVVGASSYDAGQADEGAVFLFLGSLLGIADGNPISAYALIQSNQASALLGFGVGSAGDVNGDGYGDLIVGAPQYDAGQSNEGAAFVFLGSRDGIEDGSPATAYAQLESDQANAQLGGAVATAGDVNGDGYADVLAGARFFGAGQAAEGAAFVFHGGAKGLVGANPGNANGAFGSNQAGGLLGASVASAGDVDGDGHADVIVGVADFDAGETDEGAAFVYRGSAFGVSGVAVHAVLESNDAGAKLGTSVASAGDVNGDGYGDVVVGAPAYQNGLAVGGAALVYLGSAGGIGSGGPAVALALLDARQEGQPEGPLGFPPENFAPEFGSSVASAGDVNGDGYGDIVVGSRGYDQVSSGPFTPSIRDMGAAFVFLGSATGLASGPASSAHAELAGLVEDGFFGRSVASAGDVNGDGYGDVIVGEHRHVVTTTFPPSLPTGGAAYLYHGSATGVLAGGPAFAHTWILSTANDFGRGVGSAGDVNGDGYDDVIVGDPSANGAGAAFLFHGSPTGVASSLLGSFDPDTSLVGDQIAGRFGWAVAGGGDLDGDGYADVIVGAPDYDAGQIDEGAAFSFMGGPLGVPSGGPANAGARIESDQVSASLGSSVSFAGDVNGDAYADVIVGAPRFDSPEIDEGAAFVFLSNSGGRSIRSTQRRGNGSGVRVQPWGRAESETQFGVELRASHPAGLGRVRAEVEACPSGVAFGQPGCTKKLSPSWVPLSTAAPDVLVSTTVTGLVAGELYAWRARVLHGPPVGVLPTNPAHGPWRRLDGIGSASRIRTVPDPGVGVGTGVGAFALSLVVRRRRRRAHG